MKPKGSIFRGLSRRESEDLLNAVKYDKYWKMDPSSDDFICVVALSRARVSSRRGMYARATHLKRVEVSKEAAKFCRKWRILLVDMRTRMAISVITWRAFNKIVSNELGQAFCFFSRHGKLSPYINIKAVSKPKIQLFSNKFTLNQFVL
ncbi:MAG: hypothetical protein ACUVQ0_04865 [Thermoproteota archaeon]